MKGNLSIRNDQQLFSWFLFDKILIYIEFICTDVSQTTTIALLLEFLLHGIFDYEKKSKMNWTLSFFLTDIKKNPLDVHVLPHSPFTHKTTSVYTKCLLLEHFCFTLMHATITYVYVSQIIALLISLTPFPLLNCVFNISYMIIQVRNIYYIITSTLCTKLFYS